MNRRSIQVGDRVRVRPEARVPLLADKIGIVIGGHSSCWAIDFPSFEHGHSCSSALHILFRSTTSEHSGWFMPEENLEPVNEVQEVQEQRLSGTGRYQIIMGEEWERTQKEI